jgi:hypothetical protein
MNSQVSGQKPLVETAIRRSRRNAHARPEAWIVTHSAMSAQAVSSLVSNAKRLE